MIGLPRDYVIVQHFFLLAGEDAEVTSISSFQRPSDRYHTFF
jgi:hypothetical protein